MGTIAEIMENMQALRRMLVVKALAKSELASAKCTITPSQWEVLRAVTHRDGISIKELAVALTISSSATTQAVDALEKKGLLVRASDKVDRRSTLVRLHPSYGKEMRGIHDRMVKTFTTVFEALSDAELEQFAALTGKIAAASRTR